MFSKYIYTFVHILSIGVCIFAHIVIGSYVRLQCSLCMHIYMNTNANVNKKSIYQIYLFYFVGNNIICFFRRWHVYTFAVLVSMCLANSYTLMLHCVHELLPTIMLCQSEQNYRNFHRVIIDINYIILLWIEAYLWLFILYRCIEYCNIA